MFAWKSKELDLWPGAEQWFFPKGARNIRKFQLLIFGFVFSDPAILFTFYKKIKNHDSFMKKTPEIPWLKNTSAHCPDSAQNQQKIVSKTWWNLICLTSLIDNYYLRAPKTHCIAEGTVLVFSNMQVSVEILALACLKSRIYYDSARFA